MVLERFHYFPRDLNLLFFFFRFFFFFLGGGGGQDANFYRNLVKMLISIENYRTYDFPEEAYPSFGSAYALILEFKIIFLAPFNYIETHCTWEPLWSSG